MRDQNKNNRKSLLLTIALALGAAAIMGAGTSGSGQPALTIAKRLPGKTWQAVQLPLATLWERRGTLATALTRQAKTSSPATRAAAMYLLGLYRMARAVPALAANIGFRHAYKNSALPARGTSVYPAAAALIRIGSPAIPAMVRNLEETGKPGIAACSAWVIRKVEGRLLGACVIRLALRRASTPLEKARLRAALSCVSSKAWRWDYWSPIKLPGNLKWPLPRPKK